MPVGLILGATALLAFGAVMSVVWLEPARGRLCATTVQRSTARSRIQLSPAIELGTVAASLETSIAVTLDAFPAERRVGVPGTLTPLVWKSLQQWPDPVIDVARGGYELALRSPLPPLATSESRDQYVFGDSDATLMLRLKRSEIGAIYAFVAKRAGGEFPSVIFLDRRGAVVFTVIPGEHGQDGFLPAHFRSTLRYMATLPGVCEVHGPEA